jgi:hypothetical protein
LRESHKVWEATRHTYIFEHIRRFFFFTPIALAPEKPYLAEIVLGSEMGESVVPTPDMISCAMSATWLLPHSLSI